MARTAPRQPGPPAGVIFGCNRSSEEESLNGLFGMSSGHWNLVKEIIPGTPCFLFNFNTKAGLLLDFFHVAALLSYVQLYMLGPCSEVGALADTQPFGPDTDHSIVCTGTSWGLQSCLCWWLEH